MRPALLLALLATACAAAGPVPLRWGEESCRHCHMTLADKRFGAEIVTTRGRDLSFDDAGCAAEALAFGETPVAEVSSVWVIDYRHPDSLIAAKGAVFVRSATFHTPMGSGVVATGDSASAVALAHESQGVVLRWTEVLASAGRGELRPH
ncbi:MAG: nitrous oxide reductase accessory protein NosL [Gemmatimonadetes bacterium]|nr:nitrous oxide reductase accessory protein NosL [Gemmatimonadota bacterium]